MQRRTSWLRCIAGLSLMCQVWACGSLNQVPQCQQDLDCNSGQICQNDQCKKRLESKRNPEVSKPCFNSRDCLEEYICRERKCVTQQNTPAIVGGTIDSQSKYPAVVKVNNNCSGTLIAANKVLTAAHCVCSRVLQDPVEGGVKYRLSAKECSNQAQVEFIKNKIVSTRSGNVKVISKFFMNLNEKFKILGQLADLALIELDQPAPTEIKPIPISSTAPKPKDSIVIVGFGYSGCSKTDYGIRHYGLNKIAYVNVDDLITLAGGANINSGDSGGAMLAFQNGVWRVVGVNSYAVCGLRSGFTNVATYYKWITQACSPNMKRCSPDAKKEQQCSSDGSQYIDIIMCPAGCKNGKCQAPICLPTGKQRCHQSGNAIEQCGLQGYTIVKKCPCGCIPDTSLRAKCVSPQVERCNKKDDNCDGRIDENWPRLGQPCSLGLGDCKRSGKYVCKPDGSGDRCSILAPSSPTPEVCDGRDNDCDGHIDNGLSCNCTPGVKEQCYPASTGCTKSPSGYICKGACKVGERTCNSKGEWSSCMGVITPLSEKCNGVDENCDGRVDENLIQTCYTGPGNTRNQGACSDGQRVCTNGQFGNCKGEVLPQPETKDGKDNDCDGLIDEGLSPPSQCKTGTRDSCSVNCRGTWLYGEKICFNSKWSLCSAICASNTTGPNICTCPTSTSILECWYKATPRRFYGKKITVPSTWNGKKLDACSGMSAKFIQGCPLNPVCLCQGSLYVGRSLASAGKSTYGGGAPTGCRIQVTSTSPNYVHHFLKTP